MRARAAVRVVVSVLVSILEASLEMGMDELREILWAHKTQSIQMQIRKTCQNHCLS